MSISKDIEYDKEGNIIAIYVDVDKEPYKDYTFYQSGRIKSEYNYRMGSTIHFSKTNMYGTVNKYL